MRKIIVCMLSIGLLPLSSYAAVSFYRAPNGQLVLEATDCQSISRLSGVTAFPDDPPTTGQEEPAALPSGDENPAEETSDTPQVPPPVADGVSTLVQALVGEDTPAKPRTSFKDISAEEMALTEADDFYERQEALLTYVRDVNWKTGLQITWRDYSVFRRLKMVCSGVTQLTKPFRVGLDAYVGNLDTVIETSTDQGINALAQAARGHSFAAMAKLSTLGMADAIDKINPFLLLTLDEDTYNKLVETDPKIAELFEDMYIFFKIRAINMEPEYDKNTKELIRISKIGKGDAFGTWHVLSEYAKKILKLNRAGKVNASDEKEIHLWKLESSMHYIKEQVRVERRAAELAAADPANTSLLQEVNEGPKKKPSLDDKARELLRRSTQEEIKNLIRKYVAR